MNIAPFKLPTPPLHKQLLHKQRQRKVLLLRLILEETLPKKGMKRQMEVEEWSGVDWREVE